MAFSGGEKKRNETVQLAVLRPRIAVIDEIDSGLDIDALRDVARRIEQMTQRPRRSRSASWPSPTTPGSSPSCAPTGIHVLSAGRIVEAGGPELADELEQTGYDAIAQRHGLSSTQAVERTPDPFSDPGF